MARRWRRCPVAVPLMRVPWGEGNAGTAALARGVGVRVCSRWRGTARFECPQGDREPGRRQDCRLRRNAGRVAAAGCFGNGFVVGLARCSYKSKFFVEGKQPLLLLDEPPLSLYADHATNDQAGDADGMGTRAVVVAVRDCDFPWGDGSGGTAVGAMRPCQCAAARKG